MKYETETASVWLSKQLNDSLLGNEQLCRFQQILQSGMCNKYASHWYENQPARGQAFRSVIIDIENKFVDELILDACNRAGIDDFLQKLQVPFKGLTMWIDPGEVEVQFFQHRDSQIIFSKYTGANVGMPLPVPRSTSPKRNTTHKRTPSPPAIRSFSPPARSFSPAYQPTPLFVPPSESPATRNPHRLAGRQGYAEPIADMYQHEFYPQEWEQPTAFSQYAAPSHVLYHQVPPIMAYQPQIGTFA